MRLIDVNVRAAGPTVRVTGRIERAADGGVVEPYVEYEVDPQCVGGAPEMVAGGMRVPAVARGEPLEIDAPISPRLAMMLPRIRDIFHAWWPEFPRIDIDVTPAPVAAAAPPHHSATFFSGGVDSFYTFLKYDRGHA